MHQQLGTILVANGICTQQAVDSALAKQRELAARNHFKHLGAILLEMGLIRLQDLHWALEQQQGSAAGS